MAMQTKQRILNAALELFSAKGYDKTSLSDIARSAGVTRGAVYWHFEDKGELLLEICHELASKTQLNQCLFAATRDSEADPLGCLKSWIKLHGKSNSVQIFSSVIASIVDDIVHSHDEGDRAVRERLTELFRSRLSNIREALCHAVRRGQLPADSDVDLIAEVLQAFLVGYCHMIKNNMHDNFTRHFDVVVDSMFASITGIRTHAAYHPNYI